MFFSLLNFWLFWHGVRELTIDAILFLRHGKSFLDILRCFGLLVPDTALNNPVHTEEDGWEDDGPEKEVVDVLWIVHESVGDVSSSGPEVTLNLLLFIVCWFLHSQRCYLCSFYRCSSVSTWLIELVLIPLQLNLHHLIENLLRGLILSLGCHW